MWVSDEANSSRVALLWRISLVLSVAFAVAQVNVGLSNDLKVILHYALHLYEDGGLYERWVEINPPLVFILNIPSALLARSGLVAPDTAVFGLAVLWSTLSNVALYELLNRSELTANIKTAILSAALVVLFVLPVCFHVFADREHLLFVLAMPWIMAMVFGVRAPVYLIVAAAVGFCLKPYNLAIPAMLILFGGAHGRGVRARVLSRDAAIIASVVVAYGGLVAVAFPAYLTDVIPTLRVSYSTIKYALIVKLLTVVLSANVGVLWYQRLGTGNQTRNGLIGLFTGTAVCFLANGGWFYTYYLLAVPTVLVGVLSLSVTLGDEAAASESRLRSRVRYLLAAGVLLACLVGMRDELVAKWTTGYSTNYNSLPFGLLEDLAGAADGPFILLSTTLWGSNITRLDGEPRHVYPYDFLWSLPWIALNPDHPETPRLEAQLVDAFDTALADEPGLTVIVDTSPVMRGLPDGLDILGEFREMEGFSSGFSDFQLRETFDVCRVGWQNACRFEVWSRVANE